MYGKILSNSYKTLRAVCQKKVRDTHAHALQKWWEEHMNKTAEILTGSILDFLLCKTLLHLVMYLPDWAIHLEKMNLKINRE